MMELLTLPRVRNHQLQTVSENSVKICTEIPELEKPLLKVTELIVKFKAGMTKEKASAADKKELDNDRDSLTANFIKVVKAERYFPFDNEEAKAAIEQVVEVVDNYGIKMTRLSYDEESAAIDNFMVDLNKIDFTPLAESGIARWIPVIEASNKRFKAAVYEYIDDGVIASEVESATMIAPALKNALNDLYSMMYAHLKINHSPDLETAYAQVQLLLNSYR